MKNKNEVESYYFGESREINKKILFIKRMERLSAYKDHCTDIIEFGNVWHGFSGKYSNERVTVIATGIGPGMVGDCVYAINKPGAIVLYSGTAGGLSNNLKFGDYIVANKAICGDGYSLYFNQNFLSVVEGDKDVLSNLCLHFQKMQINNISGTVYTTSSVVREVDEDFWNFVKKDCIAIEMGAAAFYSASYASDKKAGAYFWITDFPKTNKSFWGKLTDNEKNIKNRIYINAVETDLNLLLNM